MGYIRTQVYLDSDVYQMIKVLAAQEGVKKSEMVRKVMRDGLEKVMKSRKKKNAGSGLLAMAMDAEKKKIKGPKDLSENMIDYLYGSKSEYAEK